MKFDDLQRNFDNLTEVKNGLQKENERIPPMEERIAEL